MPNVGHLAGNRLVCFVEVMLLVVYNLIDSIPERLRVNRLRKSDTEFREAWFFVIYSMPRRILFLNEVLCKHCSHKYTVR